MKIFTTKAYYRASQIASIAFLPAVIIALIFIKIEDRIVVNGIIESDNHLIMRSALEDKLVKTVLVKPGQSVKHGEALVELEDLGNWRVELERTQSQYDLAKEKAEVYSNLKNKGAQSGLSAKTYENQAKILEIEIKSLKQQIDRLTVRAPFDGKITEVMVKKSEKVDIGTPIVALSAMDEKIVRCNVPEARFPYLQLGQKVAIKSNLYNYFTFEIYTGVVKTFDAYASHTTKEPVFETKIKVTGKGAEILKVGSTAQCEIIVEKQPLYALLLGDNKKGK